MHNKPIEKKIEQGLGVIFEIVVQLFEKIKKVFYNNKKFFMTSPPPRRRTFRRTFRKKFLGHFKKNIVQRNGAEKKILARNWGLKKNSCTEKLPNPPPLKYLMVRPLVNFFAVKVSGYEVIW